MWRQLYACEPHLNTRDRSDRSPQDRRDDVRSRRVLPATPWRVFLSHTSEFREYPQNKSYVNHAEQAVIAAEHTPVDMEYFGAADQRPADMCAAKVNACDVYVGIFGMRYGSPVRDRPEVSYTELEFDTATEAGLERLVFVLNESTEDARLPVKAVNDPLYGQRQQAFLERVRNSGVTVQRFSTPENLEKLLERSLRQLADRSVPKPATGAFRPVAARPVPKYLPHMPDRREQDAALTEALRRWMKEQEPLPLVVMLHGEWKQALSTYVERFLQETAEPVLKTKPEWETKPKLNLIDLPQHTQLARMTSKDFLDYLDNGLISSDVQMDLQQLLAARRQPLVLSSSVNPSEWPDGGAILLEQLCQAWGACEATRGRHLIHFIVMTYHGPGRPPLRPMVLRWLVPRYWRYKWKLRRHNRLCKRLDASLEHIVSSGGVHAVALPRFCDVHYDDVRRWLDSDRVKTFVPEGGLRSLRRDIDALYPLDPMKDAVVPLPMDDLANDLFECLERAIAP